MRRTVDEAFLDLRRALDEWVKEGARPGIKIFVYPPEWEARMLARFPRFAHEMATVSLDIVDVGQAFLDEVDRRHGLEKRLAALEARGVDEILHDLGELGYQCLSRALATPIEPPNVARLLINTGALGTFVSYSAITNAAHGGPASGVAAPTVLAFPGEGDDRQLNFMHLRPDTNYRVPRI